MSDELNLSDMNWCKKEIESLRQQLVEKDALLTRVGVEYEQRMGQLAESQKQSIEDSENILRLIETIKYLQGIAVRGSGIDQSDDQTVEQFVLSYVKGLEQQLAAALAACKLKDAAIKDLLEFATYSTCGKAHAVEAAKEALTIQPDDQLAAAYEAGKRDASEDLEQAAFENWLYDKCPSGDVESVQSQWLKSYEYAEFAEKLEQAAAGILIESLRQQLAAAIAACKLKDELLYDIKALESENGTVLSSGECSDIAAEALAIQPDDSALKAWLGEPVAWLHETRHDSDVITDAVKNVWNGVVVGKMAQYSIPLYAQKRLTK